MDMSDKQQHVFSTWYNATRVHVFMYFSSGATIHTTYGLHTHIKPRVPPNMRAAGVPVLENAPAAGDGGIRVEDSTAMAPA